MADRRRATARAAAAPAPRGRPGLRALAPSARSLAIALALLAVAAAAYVAALETPMFAVRRLDIAGASPRLRAQVRAALAPDLGRSLLRVTRGELDRRLGAVPGVSSVSFDRAFPHTLELAVRPERPVLLLRRGSDGFVVSATGRVLRRVRDPRISRLPRAWIPSSAPVTVGGTLGAEAGGLAADAVAALGGQALYRRVRFVRASTKELTLVLGSGIELRLGNAGDLRLKYAIARRILAVLGKDTTSGYIDVSVPQRPVVGDQNSQVVA